MFLPELKFPNISKTLFLSSWKNIHPGVRTHSLPTWLTGPGRGRAVKSCFVASSEWPGRKSRRDSRWRVSGQSYHRNQIKKHFWNKFIR